MKTQERRDAQAVTIAIALVLFVAALLVAHLLLGASVSEDGPGTAALLAAAAVAAGYLWRRR